MHLLCARGLMSTTSPLLLERQLRFVPRSWPLITKRSNGAWHRGDGHWLLSSGLVYVHVPSQSSGTIRLVRNWCWPLLICKDLTWTGALSQTRYTRKPKPVSPKLGADAPGVSIIRPLKGVDLELADNLRSSFEQQYPKFEIIFSVASADDPAVPIVEQLMKEYKSVGSRLIIGTLQKRWMRNNMYIYWLLQQKKAINL